MKKNLKFILLLIIFLAVILTAFSADVFGAGGHSTLDIVDPSFNPRVQTTAYGLKWVSAVQVQPDGKLLALGGFGFYNGAPVGKLIRLNPDGTLDPTFNNQLLSDSLFAWSHAKIFIQPDGKIVVRCPNMVAGGQALKQMIRLNPDGTLDPSFNFENLADPYFSVEMDSLGRFVIPGRISTPGFTTDIMRLHPDGTLDTSFSYTIPTDHYMYNWAVWGSRVFVLTSKSGVIFGEVISTIFRLNDDGSNDPAFTPYTSSTIAQGTLAIQPDGKILYQSNFTVKRLNENGSPDNGFQSISVSGYNGSFKVRFTTSGKIIMVSSGSPVFKRFSANGAPDPSFSQFTATNLASFVILPDDRMVVADGIQFGFPSGANHFVRLTSGGVPDPTFNPGGSGFQTVFPGSVEALETYPDGKVLLGGKFDLVNNQPRFKLARLNADSTVDAGFQVNAGGTGNYFSSVSEIYQIRVQPDGKIIVIGNFEYFLNGASKRNLVRLNSDGSIDATFNLTYYIPQGSVSTPAGPTRFSVLSDGKMIVGISRIVLEAPSGPVKLTADGARDTSFNTTLNTTSSGLYIDDVVVQPDGKVLVGGSHTVVLGPMVSETRSFVARLNTDGSVDATFLYTEEPNRLYTRLILLPDGKILVSKSIHRAGGSARVQRLNSDGSIDNSFNTVTLPDTTAKLNTLLLLPNGKIFVGGRFTLTVNGQPAKNLLQLEEDGNFAPTLYNLNDEVLALAADSEGRVLVGGGFTVIGAGDNEGESRTYVARLTDSRAPFDFDGDGKTDVGVYRPSNGQWWYIRSSDSQSAAAQFSNPTDIPVPGDYTGDGKADIAHFRPETGEWFILRSEDGSYYSYQFGLPGDIPAPADYDGDGVMDTATFRPSTASWYIFNSGSSTYGIATFGLDGDKPVPADYDGDGKADIAVWRPSNGTWWYIRSSDLEQKGFGFGLGTDKPVPGDWTGDGKADIAVWRPATSEWFILRSEDGSYYSLPFGLPGDVPVPGDYDGDGRFDTAVFRPTETNWYVQRSTAGIMIRQFGLADDTPVPSAFVP